MTREMLASTRADDLARFYRALRRLEEGIGGTRKLSSCDGRMSWPTHGVYFFLEVGELRSDSGTGSRVVRVGSHAVSTDSRATLWNRLSQHRGPAATGGGNHRGSIFRWIVGESLMARDPAFSVETWSERKPGSKGHRAKERELERLVSRVMGAMPLLWLRVDGPAGPESQRGYIEQKAIALLSNHGCEPLDPPSDNWLGLHCPKDKVRTSGLWNQRHVEEAHDSAFLPTLESLVTEHIAGLERP